MNYLVSIISSILLITGCTAIKTYNIIKKEPDIRNTTNTDLTAKFQNILDSSVNKYNLIGVQIAVKMKNGDLWFGSSGTADIERLKILSNDNLIRIGSLSKTFTAVIIMQLYEKGLINIDDTIDKWFPDFPESNKITIRMLLNHSSGIPEFLGPKIFIPSMFYPEKIWSVQDLYYLIKKNKLLFQPGKGNSYSNPNYILLGIIAEKTSNRSLNDLYKNEIIEPLKMNNTVFLPYEKYPESLISGYDRSLIPVPGWYINKPEYNSWSSCAYSSGGFASTAHDLLLFYNSVLTKKIIQKSSYDIMTKFMTAEKPKNKYLKNFGYGIFKYGDYYDNSFGHSGLFIGSEAEALFNQEKGYIVIFTANVSQVNGKDKIIKEYIDILKLK